MLGQIVGFIRERGFGFVYSDDLKRRIFFHISEFFGAPDPIPGQRVKFELAPGRKPGQDSIAVKVVVEHPEGVQTLLDAKTIAGVQVTTAKTGAE